MGQLNEGPKIEIADNRLAARSRSYFSFICLFIYLLFFFSFSVFPFTLVLPRFLYFFFSFFPLFLLFPSLLPFLPTDRKFADGHRTLGGVTPPHPQLATPLDPRPITLFVEVEPPPFWKCLDPRLICLTKRYRRYLPSIFLDLKKEQSYKQ